MLVRDDGALLMVQRPTTARFAPGAWVFPGGLVEPHDGLDDLETGEASDTPIDLTPYRIAALREALEEAGVTCLTPGQPPAIVAALRARTLAGEALTAVCADHGCAPDADALAYVSYWVTPTISPLRYSTRFFVAPAPADLPATADGDEIIACRWLRAADALDAYRAGTFSLIYPQLCQLGHLAAFDTADALLAWARSQPAVPANAPGLPAGVTP